MQHTPHIAPAYCYRCPFGLYPESCSLECAEDLERTILYEGPDSISAFIAEPIVGAAAGVLVPRDGYFQRIREICNQHDILLIVDEVMTGIGRTGKNFGIDHWEVIPDLIVAAKGLASGYSPIFCVIAKEEIHCTLKERSGAFVHGHTYSQNPVSCAVGLAVLSYLEDNQLIARCAEMGSYFLDRLQMLRERRIVGDVRGRGLFAGVEYVKDKKTKETFDPGLKVNGLIGDTAFEKGLITYPGGGGADGVKGDHTLLAPPFIITKDEIDELVGILDESIAEVEGAIM
jgi:adenosylmethionine-8-amino-7-oxononanoate aminotransferase